MAADGVSASNAGNAVLSLIKNNIKNDNSAAKSTNLAPVKSEEHKSTAKVTDIAENNVGSDANTQNSNKSGSHNGKGSTVDSLV